MRIILFIITLIILGAILFKLITVINIGKQENIAYLQKVNQWSADWNEAHGVITRTLNGDVPTQLEISNTAHTLATIQQEIHATVPPAQYTRKHAILIESIDLYIDALREYSAGNTSIAHDKLERSMILLYAATSY